MTAILYPIRSTDLARSTPALSYALRVVVNGIAETRAFPVSGALTAGRNYWLAGDDQVDDDGGVGGIGDLMRALERCIESHSEAPAVTPAVSATGRVTLLADVAIQLLWGNVATTLNAAVFGFPQLDSVLSTTHATPNQGWGWHCPGHVPLDDTRWRRPVNGGTRTTIGGRTRTSRFGEGARTRTIRWASIAQSVALMEYSPVTEPRGSFEAAWYYGLSRGRELRYYEDAANRTPTSYALATIAESMTDDPLDRDPAYPVEWAYALDLVERTP